VLHGVREERRGEKVRDPSNPPKSGRILCQFSHLVNYLFASIHPCFCVKSSPILCCDVFYFCDFWRYFWSDFRSHDLSSFSSIHSVGFGAKTSLIIYLQPWSEFMTLAPLIWRISPGSTKT
jgi:hypothetical protein